MTGAAPFLLLAAMAAISWCAGRHVHAGRLPMQWDFRGRPTWYAPRRVALWFPVLIAAFVVTVTWMTSDHGTPVWVMPVVALVSLGAKILYLVLLFRWQRNKPLN